MHKQEEGPHATALPVLQRLGSQRPGGRAGAPLLGCSVMPCRGWPLPGRSDLLAQWIPGSMYPSHPKPQSGRTTPPMLPCRVS